MKFATIASGLLPTEEVPVDIDALERPGKADPCRSSKDSAEKLRPKVADHSSPAQTYAGRTNRG